MSVPVDLLRAQTVRPFLFPFKIIYHQLHIVTYLTLSSGKGERSLLAVWSCEEHRISEVHQRFYHSMKNRKRCALLLFYWSKTQQNMDHVMLSSLNAQDCMCIRWACMQERRHADRVFTSPTLSRLSSFSSREVVYKGS